MTNFDPVPSAQVARLVQEADSFADRRDWISADACYRQAMNLDSSPASRIAYGICLAEQERYFEAITVFTCLLDNCDRNSVGIVCHNLAVIYREVGDDDLARRFQWRATLYQDSSGSEEILGMANDALTGGHHEMAASLVITALELNDDKSDEHSDADMIATTGLIKAALDSPQDGLVTIFSAYRRHQAAADLRGMGADLLNMAFLFGEVDRYRAQRACLVRALRCFEQASARHSCQRARMELNRFDRMQLIRTFDARRN